jgi:type I restriction enzyme S subunit
MPSKHYKLSDLLTEFNRKSFKNNQYEIISSTTKGIFLQSDYFNKQAASEDTTGYKILEKNQFVLSPQNLWMGNININFKYDVGIVSPSYKIFKIDPSVNLNIFNSWIKTKRALYEFDISSEQGASVVRKNLNMRLFNLICLNLPEIKIQDKYGFLIKYFEDKLRIENNKLRELHNLKKGLIQNIFV